MTRKTAIVKLRKLQFNDDYEYAHSRADDILTELLTDLGYGDVVEEWAKVGKWYA